MARSKFSGKRREDLALHLGKIIEGVDFPDFVVDLIDGTFQVIVHGSIRQMAAYASLVKDAASAIDDFRKDKVSAERAYDRLVQKYGARLGPDWPPKRERLQRQRRGRRTLARDRQQLLSTMVLMGINRIVGTGG